MENQTRNHWSDKYLAVLLICEIRKQDAYYKSGIKSLDENLENDVTFDREESLTKCYQDKAIAEIYAYKMLANQGLKVLLENRDLHEDDPDKRKIATLQFCLNEIEKLRFPNMVWYPPNFETFDIYLKWFWDRFKMEAEKISVTA